jgi:hypothetical protein
MNLPIDIPQDKRTKFYEIVTAFQNDLMSFDELSQEWLEGFCNYLLHSHTDQDDDNNYDPSVEKPQYTSYKAGAKAGMEFIERSGPARPRRLSHPRAQNSQIGLPLGQSTRVSAPSPLPSIG